MKSECILCQEKFDIGEECVASHIEMETAFTELPKYFLQGYIIYQVAEFYLQHCAAPGTRDSRSNAAPLQVSA